MATDGMVVEVKGAERGVSLGNSNIQVPSLSSARVTSRLAREESFILRTENPAATVSEAGALSSLVPIPSSSYNSCTPVFLNGVEWEVPMLVGIWKPSS